jgi:DNA-binding SARP family transcriptional activator
MDSLPSSEERSSEARAENYSAPFILERALEYVQQKHLSEGVAYLRLARERLAPSQIYLANTLDVFIEGYTSYQHAQHILQEASRHFAAAYAEQQARIADFTTSLPALITDLHTSDVLPDLVSNIQDQQAFQLPPRGPQEPLSSPAYRPSCENGTPLLDLYITCFGHFEVRRHGKLVNLCSSRNGQSILRYLVSKTEHCATSDLLQTLFWPDDEPEVCQNKLHIAISALRRCLNHGSITAPTGGYILCKGGVYQFNPAVSIHTDVDEFLRCYQVGRQMQMSEERVALYERACHLYTGSFLVEDLYADWSFLQREQLSRTYLTMCRTLVDYYLQNQRYEHAAQWATTMLKENRCDEAAHCQLIQIYALQGRRGEALQQYQHCERLLRQELGVSPLPETTALLTTLLADQPPPRQQ